VIVKIHHQVLPAAHGPGSLPERKADLKDAKAVALPPNSGGDIGEEAEVQGVGKAVACERRLRQDAVFGAADVLVNTPVPYHPKDVLNTVIAKIGEKADVAP
jgi:hypothetical protein